MIYTEILLISRSATPLLLNWFVPELTLIGGKRVLVTFFSSKRKNATYSSQFSCLSFVSSILSSPNSFFLQGTKWKTMLQLYLFLEIV